MVSLNIEDREGDFPFSAVPGDVDPGNLLIDICMSHCLLLIVRTKDKLSEEFMGVAS